MGAVKLPDNDAAESGDVLLLGIAALAKAVDASGATAKRAAMLIRLSMSMTGLSSADRTRLTVLASILEVIGTHDAKE